MVKIKRPVLVFTIGFLIGIIYGLYFKKSIAFTYVGLLLFYSLQKAIKEKKTNNKLVKYLKVILNYKIVLLICVSSIISNTYLIYLNNKYEKVYNSITNIKTEAVILGSKEEKEYTYTYLIKIKKGTYKNKKFILSIKKDKVNTFKYGDLISFEGEFLVTSKATNFKGFDYSLYLKSKNIYGTIKANNANLIKKNDLNFFLLKSNCIREKIINKTSKLLPSEDGGLFIGIILGDKHDISKEVINSFKKSNLMHILAVSGMHISYIILRSNICFK